MKHDAIYIAKYSSFKLLITFILLYPLPLYIIIGSSIDLFAASKYINSLSLILVVAPLICIFIESLLTKEIIFYNDSVSKIWHLFGEIRIEYAGGYIVCPTGFSRFLSSAYHIRGNNYSILHRIIFISFFFSTDTRKNVEDLISFLTDNSRKSVRKFSQIELPGSGNGRPGNLGDVLPTSPR